MTNESNLASVSGKRITVTSTLGNVTRTVECKSNQEASGIVEYELGVGAANISLTVEWVKQNNSALCEPGRR